MTNNKGLKGQSGQIGHRQEQDRQAYGYMDTGRTYTGKPGTRFEARAKRESRAAMKSRKPTMRAAEQGLGAAKG